MATGIDLYVDEAMATMQTMYPQFHAKLDSAEQISVRGAIRAGIDAALYQQRLQLAHLVANADDLKSAAVEILEDS